MPPKSTAFAAQATNDEAAEEATPIEAKAKAVKKPSPDVYKELREELDQMQAALKKRSKLLSEAIFPAAHDEQRRIDVRDWIKWIADEQVGGLKAWLIAAEVSDDKENPLAAQLSAAEERAVELQEALDAFQSVGKQSNVRKGSAGKVKPDAKAEPAEESEEGTLEDMGEHDKGSAGKVKAEDKSPVVIYDEDDEAGSEEEAEVEEPKAAPKPKAPAKKRAPAKPKAAKGTGKPGS
jgi:hypothetical protein